MSLVRTIVLLALSPLLCGCAQDRLFSSRWAMDDPDYAAKYGHPYAGDTKDKWLRMTKQAVDSRFVAGKSGTQIGARFHGHPFYGGGELGMFHYNTSWLSTHASLAGLLSEGRPDWTVGGDLGLQAEIPARVAPYVGIGTYLGYWTRTTPADNDGIDNDDDGFIDERTEKRKDLDGFLNAVYPEAGIRAWLTPSTRITAGARYYITSEGRDHDSWVYGISIGTLFGSGSSDDTDE